MIDQAIENYFKGKSSKEEQALLARYLRDKPEHRAYFSSKKKQLMEDASASYTLSEWEAWQCLKVKIQNREAGRRRYLSPFFYRSLAMGAVGAVLALLVVIPAFHKQKVFVRTNPGQSLELLLPDSTSVTLNSSSTLAYHPLSFMLSRRVEMEGEAFFKVQKNKWSSFRVVSDNLKVKVTGTEFNVNAYRQYNRFRVVLVEGAVQVSGLVAAREDLRLQPGEMFEWDGKERKARICKVNPKLHTSWKEGLLYFYDSDFWEVLERVETRFGVDFEVDDEVVNSFLLSTTIGDESLENVLDLFKKALPITIDDEEGTFLIQLDKERYENRKKNNQS